MENKESEHVTILSDRDRDRFLEVLESDDEPNEALKEAAEKYKKLIIQEQEPDID